MTGTTDRLLPPSRLIEWEPYKAACGNRFKKQEPFIPSQLIAYEINNSNIPPKCRPDFLEYPQMNERSSCAQNGSHLEKPTTSRNETPEEEDEQARLSKEVQTLRRELEIERDVNSELKRLLVNALSEDINCKLSSLAEDKVRLAKHIDTYYNRERNNAENREQLHIENTLWKSKFMAIAIRADDLNYNLNVALKLFKKAQLVISDLSRNVQSKSGELGKTICELLNIDVLSLYNKSPCDELHRQPFTSSLTITCCGRCSDKQIQLV